MIPMNKMSDIRVKLDYVIVSVENNLSYTHHLNKIFLTCRSVSGFHQLNMLLKPLKKMWLPQLEQMLYTQHQNTTQDRINMKHTKI